MTELGHQATYRRAACMLALGRSPDITALLSPQRNQGVNNQAVRLD